MLIKSEVRGAEVEAMADVITQFLEEDLAADSGAVRNTPSSVRSHTADAIVLTATVLQGAAAGIYIADYIDAKRRVTDTLNRLRVLLGFGGNATLQVDEHKPMNIATVTPDEVLSELSVHDDKTDQSPRT
jgi:hypothetical protein